MKIPRSAIGQLAVITWRDPCSAHVKSHTRDHSDLPKGTAVLATQVERGVIGDVTDGIVRIEHTEGTDSHLVPDPTDDLYCTWVPEGLIEKLVLYVESRALPTPDPTP